MGDDWIFQDHSSYNARHQRGAQQYKRRPIRRPYAPQNYIHAPYQSTNYNTPQQQHHFIEFFLKNVIINEYSEELDKVDDCGGMKFRYKYLQDSISIFLNENKSKIYIPLESLESISKIHNDTLVLTIKPEGRPLMSYVSRDGFQNDDPIRNNLSKTTQIRIVAHEIAPQQTIDMCGLHINFQLNKSEKPKHKGHITNWGRINNRVSSPEEELILKCHLGSQEREDIRILRFSISTPYDVIKQNIQEVYNISEISKLKYKDDESSFISIVSHADFETALKLYVQNHKLEVWCFNE